MTHYIGDPSIIPAPYNYRKWKNVVGQRKFYIPHKPDFVDLRIDGHCLIRNEDFYSTDNGQSITLDNDVNITDDNSIVEIFAAGYTVGQSYVNEEYNLFTTGLSKLNKSIAFANGLLLNGWNTFFERLSYAFYKNGAGDLVFADKDEIRDTPNGFLTEGEFSNIAYTALANYKTTFTTTVNAANVSVDNTILPPFNSNSFSNTALAELKTYVGGTIRTLFPTKLARGDTRLAGIGTTSSTGYPVSSRRINTSLFVKSSTVRKFQVSWVYWNSANTLIDGGIDVFNLDSPSTSIEEYANGWYRLKSHRLLPNSVVKFMPNFDIETTVFNDANTYGQGKTINVWGYSVIPSSIMPEWFYQSKAADVLYIESTVPVNGSTFEVNFEPIDYQLPLFNGEVRVNRTIIDCQNSNMKAFINTTLDGSVPPLSNPTIKIDSTKNGKIADITTIPMDSQKVSLLHSVNQLTRTTFRNTEKFEQIIEIPYGKFDNIGRVYLGSSSNSDNHLNGYIKNFNVYK